MQNKLYFRHHSSDFL